ncbi:MAG TPA: MXAN_2562 family outer membrane beta-barrel protein [Polyangiaceae bacterium]|nr:MXAN_2562 family outer membrane beta-barrel protein [Polyangiaceae bacterium]
MKKLLSTLLGSAALLAVSPAFAQGVDEFGAYGGLENRGHERSPQNVAFEARFGPYRPGVDADLPGHPYKDIFGDATRWEGGIEVDWQVFRIPHTLSLGPGLGWAFTQSSAKAPLTVPLPDGQTLSAENTTLAIMPMHLVATLRLDWLADHTVVPLVPYAKLGMGYALWWSNIGESSTRVNGEVGKGASYGYVAALGLMLRLDPLDPLTAATADASLGINHSGLFIEYFKSNLNGFGSDTTMEVGTSTWVAGLVLEI